MRRHYGRSSRSKVLGAKVLGAKVLGAVGVLLFISSTGWLSTLVWAHEADCPHCDLPVVQDTATQDNEVELKYGRKTIDYRCVFCAIDEAKEEYKGNLTIIAPSETKGRPVIIKRMAGKWSVMPRSAVFVYNKVNHRYCHLGYRALTSRAAFAAYAKKNKKSVGNAQPMTLAQFVAKIK